jgi:hypothetical protein
MSEICRIILEVNRAGLTDLHGPLDDKWLCREMLDHAAAVMAKAPDHAFQKRQSGAGSTIIITYDESGRVDVGAPLPNREFCALMLAAGHAVVDRYGEESAPRQFGGTVVH